jgi:hypothetical protein
MNQPTPHILHSPQKETALREHIKPCSAQVPAINLGWSSEPSSPAEVKAVMLTATACWKARPIACLN